MSPEEFERLKEQEKQHLRQLRGLKAQHRDVQRKGAVLDALQGMARPDLDATHDEFTDKLSRDAALQEARMEIAMEGSEPAEQAEIERERLRKADAELLVAQLRAELDGAPATSGPSSPDPAGGKTIGRAPAPPAPDDAPSHPDDAKTIGRRLR